MGNYFYWLIIMNNNLVDELLPTNNRVNVTQFLQVISYVI